MTKLWKRSLSMFLALAMVFSMLPAGALATELETEPVITEPVITEPVVTEPVVTQPVVTEPIVTEPVVTEPVVTEPVVTEPVVTEPAVTEPEATETEDEDTLVQETMEVSFEEAYEQETETTETEETEPELPQLIQGEFSMVPDVVPNKTDDQLFAAYVDDVFFGNDACTLGTSGRDTLSGNALETYNALRPVLESIASGARGSSAITIGYEITGYIGEDLMTFTPEISANITGETFNEADMKEAVNALLTDMPYELYWYAKTVPMSIGYIGDAGKWFVQLAFPVSASYSVSGTNDKFDPDQTKTGAAAATVAKATQIAQSEEVSGLSDYEKLVYFRDYICEQVSYNSNSGSFSDNSDPWQIIYVFDGNPDTNVVCEGYAKAFKHLCDLADFENNTILCEIVTGYTTGPHMWNIVRIDGVSYLVDVTNLDDDNILNDRAFFLTGATGSIDDGYTIANGSGGTLHYAYRYESDGEVIQSSIDTFGDGANSILILSEESYPHPYTQADLEAELEATEDGPYTIPTSLELTDSMVMDVTRTQENWYYPVYIPEGVTLTVPTGVTLTANAPLIVDGGVLEIKNGATVDVNFQIYVQSGGTMNIADGAILNVSDNAGVTLNLDGKSTINGTVSNLTAESKVTSVEELKEALAVPVGPETAYSYHGISVMSSFAIEENLAISENQGLSISNGSTLTVGTEENPATLTNDGRIFVYYGSSLIVAEGSELANNNLVMNSGGYVTGNITGNAVENSQGTDVEYTEESLAALMEEAATSGLQTDITIGNDLTITGEITIPENASIYLSQGCTLTIEDGGKLTNNGTLYIVYGSMVIDGELENNEYYTLSLDMGEGSILVSESGKLTNNEFISCRRGSITVNGTYEAGENSNLEIANGVSHDGIARNLINLVTIVDTEEEIREAAVLQEGYIEQRINIDSSVTLTEDLTVPEGIRVHIGYSWNPNEPLPQTYFTIPSGISVVFGDNVYLSECAMLHVEPGAEMLVGGTFGGDGVYINNGKFASSYTYHADTSLTETEFTDGMSLSVDKNADYYLRQSVTLTKDTDMTVGGKFYLVDGGRIEVPSGVTLTINSATEFIGGQLVVHPGGKVVLNEGLRIMRGTLYAPEGATLENEENLSGRRTWSVDEEPYLSGYWVHDWGEGYFMNDETYGENYGVRFGPGTQFEHIVYLNVFNEETLSWDQTPLYPHQLGTSEFVSVTSLRERDDVSFKLGEPNTNQFITVKIADDDAAWDTVGYLSYNYNGTELKYEIQHSRDEDFGFYSAMEAANEYWLDTYYIDFTAEENSFYFIFHDLDYIQSVDSVTVTDGADKVNFEHVSGNIYKITVDPSVVAEYGGFDLAVKVNATRTDGSAYERDHSIWIHDFYVDDSLISGRFEINGQWYMYVPSMDIYVTYAEHGHSIAELPEGVSYRESDNELTLTKANLSSLKVGYYWYDENGNLVEDGSDLPNPDFKLNLVDENTITCDYNEALAFYDGVNAEIYGNGSLDVKTITTDGQLNDEGYALSWEPVCLWNGANLTISGDAKVTATVEGVGHHENGEQTFLAAVRIGGGNLTLKDNASLTTVLPKGARRSGDTLITDEWGNTYYGGGYAGVEAVNTLTILDSSTLNTQGMYVDNYYQYGGNVTINSTGSKYYGDYYEWDDETQKDVFVDQRDGYHYDGLCAGTGTIEISGGELTINVLPTEEEHNVRSYFSGLSSEGGTITISNDAVVNINCAYDGVAIVAACVYNEDGSQGDGSELKILGGEVNITGTIPEFWPRAIDVYPVSSAEFNGGTINAVLSRFAIGGSATWKRTILNGSDIIFHVDNEFRMSSGEMNLQDMSLVEVNAFGEFSGNSYLNLENSAMVVNGECHLIHDAVVEMNQGDEDLNDFSLLVNGYLSVEENAQVLINQELTEERTMIPIIVDGNFEQQGGYVSAQQNEFCQGAAMLTWGATIIRGGTLDVYANKYGIAQGYYSDRPEDNPSQFRVEGGTVSVSSGYIGILANGPVYLYGGNVNVYAEGIIDTENSIWPHAVMVEKFTGNEDGSGDNVASLNIYGGMHSFQSVDASENEACSKALSLLNAPLNFYGGRLNLDAEMALYSFSDSLEEDNVYGDPTFHSGTTDEDIVITSREFTESEEVDNDFFHTLLEEDGSYVTVAQVYATMTVDEFLAQMDEAAQAEETFTLTHSVVLDRNITLTAGVEVIGGATLTVASGSVLTIPAGTELAARDGGAILIENGGQISNYGLLVSQYGYITADPEATVAPYVHHEDEENVGALVVYAVDDETAYVDGIDKTFITAHVEFPTEEYFEYWLNEAPASYRNVRIIRNESLYMPEGDLIIQNNVSLSFGGNEEYIPVLNVGSLSIDGELITAYATVNVATEMGIDGALTLNQTVMTVSGEWAGTDYDAVIMINDGSVLVVDVPEFYNRGIVHVGFWKADTTDGPAGTINVTENGMFTNTGWMNICEEGVVNVNGVFNNFYCRLPNMIGPEGDALSYVELAGQLNVNNELNNDTFIQSYGEDPGNGIVVAEDALLWNSDTGYIFLNGVSLNAKEGSTVRNEGLIDVNLSSAKILGTYEEGDYAQLIAGYEMAEDGTETVNMVEGVAVDQQILQLKAVYEAPAEGELIPEVNLAHVQGLMDATAYHGFRNGYVLTENAYIYINEEFTIPENISFFIGISSEEECNSSLELGEDASLMLYGSIVLRNGTYFWNDGHIHASGATIVFDGDNANVRNLAEMMLTDGTVISGAADTSWGVVGDVYDGFVYNEGSIFIVGDSRVECTALDNNAVLDGAAIHVGFSGDENIVVHEGYLVVLAGARNNGYISVDPSGQIELLNADVENLNDEYGTGYFDVHGKLYINGGSFENQGMVTAGADDGEALIEVSESANFHNELTGFVGSSANGSVVFNDTTYLSNGGYIENAGGAIAINGTYEATEDGVALVYFDVNENGSDLDVIEGLSNDQVTICHYIDSEYTYHNEDSIHEAINILKNEGYAHLQVNAFRGNLDITNELHIPENMTLSISDDDENNEYAVTVAEDVFMYNDGTINIYEGGKLTVNGIIGQGGDILSEANGQIIVNESGQLMTLFEGATTLSGENASVVNKGMMSGPAEIQGAYTHGAEAYIGGGYVVYEDGTVEVKEAVGPNLPNSIKSLNHSITADYPAHGEDTVRAYLEYVQTNGYANGSLNILPDSALDVAEDLSVPSNVEVQVYGTLNLASGVKLETEGKLTNNGTIDLDANATITANADVSNTGIVQGACGDDLTWKLENGVLTFTGSGDMINYTNVADIPWNFLADTITEIRFTGNAPAISENAFTGVTATAYYPAGDSSWDSVIDKNYGGNITWMAEGEQELFSFYAANVIMGNNMDMMFAIPKSAVADWSGHYVIINRTYADGRTNDVQNIPYEEWTTNGGYYVVTYEGLAAKEMCDTITLTVYNAAGRAVSEPWVDSMRGYVERQLVKSTNTLQKTMMVDMLNYGATAQTFFGYGADDLANSGLTEEQKAYASTGEAFSSTLNQGEAWFASNLILESNIQFLIAFKNLTTDMYATVEYTDHYGNSVTTNVSGSEFGKNGSYYYVGIETLVVSDARQVITITIYNADGSVYTVCQESIEDYLARRSSVSDLFAAIMKFADSTYAYLHRND